MKKFLLFVCIVAIVLVGGLIIFTLISAPPGVFSGASASTSSSSLPPDIAQLIASSSASSSVSAEASSTGTASVSGSPLGVNDISTTTTPFATSTNIPPATVAPYTVSWGAFAGDTPSDDANFEALVGQQMDMVAVFVGWGNNGAFPSNFEQAVAGEHKTLVIFWEPSDGSGNLTEPNYNYASISGGTWDHYLQSFAAAAKAYNGPIILVPFEEMNGNWDPWDGTVNGNSPSSFIAAWQHVYNIFEAAGVAGSSPTANVKFAWDVNNVSEPDTASNSIAVYYPGSAYVDYVGVDGFNFGDPWQSFADVFAPAIGQLQIYDKPIYIFSMASAEGPQKAAWITDALTTSMQEYPIAGWIWFNQNKEQDWLVNSDPAALAAFQAAVATSTAQ